MSKVEIRSSYLTSLEWRTGQIPDWLEADAPEGADPFDIARELREADPSAAYACLDRDGRWVIVAMPDDPPAPAQSSEPNLPTVWRTRVYVYAEAAPGIRAEFTLYGPREAMIERWCRRLQNVAPMVLHIGHDRITPVDFGPDDDGASAGWVDDNSNELAVVEAVGGIIKYVRRIYPRDVPSNAELARELAKVFASDEGV